VVLYLRSMPCGAVLAVTPGRPHPYRVQPYGSPGESFFPTERAAKAYIRERKKADPSWRGELWERVNVVEGKDGWTWEERLVRL
jgi:hypothetical protein